MRGVAQQRGATEVPFGDGLAIGGGPALPSLGQIDQLPRLWANALEIALYFLRATVGDTPLLLVAAVEGHHHVVLLAATQWVVHQVAVWSHPDAGCIPLQFLWKILLVDHRPVDHMAGDARRVVHILRPHH